MKSVFKTVLPALSLVALLSIALTSEVKSEEIDDCDVTVTNGTIRDVNPEDSFDYRCDGAFMDCTDVIMFCDPL